MSKITDDLLEDYEFIGTLVGFIAGIGILSLPAAVVKDGKQNAWMSVIIGGVYPLILGSIGIYYCRKHPNEDILVLSKKYLGNILGIICNIFFLINFLIYIMVVSSGFSNLLRVYGGEFLEPIKIVIVVVLMGAYLASKGIKVIGRVNKILLCLFLVLTLILCSAFQVGQYRYLLPIFDVSFFNILKASKESVFAYGGIEAIFLIYPVIKNKDKMPKLVYKGVFITIFIYTFITLISIYYLGHKCTGKLLWPVIMVTESINLPFINSFRLLFLLLWSIIIIKLIANEYYAILYIVKNIINNKRLEKYYILIYIAIVFLSMQLTKSEMVRRTFLDKTIPIITMFNFVYILSIALLIFIKTHSKNNRHEK